MQLLAKFLLTKLTGSFGKKLFLAFAEVLVKRTDNTLDDQLLAAIKEALA